MVWGSSKEGKYTVKELLHHELSEWVAGQLAMEQCWKIMTPPKGTCFTWLPLNDVVLTHDNLSKKKIVLVSRCHLCHQSSENVNHLFFLQCPFVAYIRNFFITVFGLHWVFPQDRRQPTLVGFVGKLIQPSRRSGERFHR